MIRDMRGGTAAMSAGGTGRRSRWACTSSRTLAPENGGSPVIKW